MSKTLQEAAKCAARCHALLAAYKSVPIEVRSVGRGKIRVSGGRNYKAAVIANIKDGAGYRKKYRQTLPDKADVERLFKQGILYGLRRNAPWRDDFLRSGGQFTTSVEGPMLSKGMVSYVLNLHENPRLDPVDNYWEHVELGGPLEAEDRRWGWWFKDTRKGRTFVRRLFPTGAPGKYIYRFADRKKKSIRYQLAYILRTPRGTFNPHPQHSEVIIPSSTPVWRGPGGMDSRPMPYIHATMREGARAVMRGTRSKNLEDNFRLKGIYSKIAMYSRRGYPQLQSMSGKAGVTGNLKDATGKANLRFADLKVEAKGFTLPYKLVINYKRPYEWYRPYSPHKKG